MGRMPRARTFTTSWCSTNSKRGVSFNCKPIICLMDLSLRSVIGGVIFAVLPLGMLSSPPETPLCKLSSLPSDIKGRLRQEFGSWKAAANLNPVLRLIELRMGMATLVEGTLNVQISEALSVDGAICGREANWKAKCRSRRFPGLRGLFVG